MKEKNNLMKKIFHLETLLHRYQVFSFRAFGPFGNPLRGQGRILSILKMQPQISQKELSYLLDMRQQSLSELLKKLERSGLITRTPSQDDRRVAIITLTEEGKMATPETEENELNVGNVFDCLSEEERETFENYLDRLSDSLEQKLKETEQAAEEFDEHGYGKYLNRSRHHFGGFREHGSHGGSPWDYHDRHNDSGQPRKGNRHSAGGKGDVKSQGESAPETGQPPTDRESGENAH